MARADGMEFAGDMTSLSSIPLPESRCQTARSLPAGSVTWNRLPPGKLKTGFVRTPLTELLPLAEGEKIQSGFRFG